MTQAQADPVAATEAALAAIERHNPELNAFTHVDAVGARLAAQASAQRRLAGQALSQIDGLTVAVKDNVAVFGLPWTAGLAYRRECVASADSDVVANLRAAGAIILGTTNMDEAALGSSGGNPTFGHTGNPAYTGYSPAGSSGGSASAVAAGLTQFAIGTDTMGSVRLPAACCGVVGFKPTNGYVSRRGVVDLSWTLDVVGLLANTVADIATAMPVIAGSDSGDPAGELAPLWDCAVMPPTVRGLRLARLATPGVAVAPSILERFDDACRHFEAEGAILIDAAIADWAPAALRRAGLLVVEAEGAIVHAEALHSPAAMSENLRSMLAYGRALSSERLALAYRTLETIGLRTRRLAAQFDALLVPTSAELPFLQGSLAPAGHADLTALANAARLPALSIPLPGASAPAGLQLIGASFRDARLLAIGDAIERILAATKGNDCIRMQDNTG